MFADRPDLAERVVRHLAREIEGAPLQLDVPEPHEAGLALAAALSLERIFGVTSFELG